MEPIITLDGFKMMQDSEKSRSMLNDYYYSQGYTIVTPKSKQPEEDNKANQQNNQQHK
ncbi:MAG: hypothetical protein ABI480_06520 [Chitinophagaceae bacterium]